ncbi:hypothetical protein HGA64_03925 [Candidatus Falkowbacteria bacterium]|nr:hypothetical protein [Candidatus Falkowbacteria bacterium]
MYKYFLRFRSWSYIRRARQESQALRKIKDRDLVSLISSNISYQEIESPALKFANLIFGWYWAVVKRIIIW